VAFNITVYKEKDLQKSSIFNHQTIKIKTIIAQQSSNPIRTIETKLTTHQYISTPQKKTTLTIIILYISAQDHAKSKPLSQIRTNGISCPCKNRVEGKTHGHA
jgi:hypothetical protein